MTQNNLRGALLASVPGKSIARVLRQQLMPVLEQSATDGPCGEIKGRSPGFCAPPVLAGEVQKGRQSRCSLVCKHAKLHFGGAPLSKTRESATAKCNLALNGFYKNMALIYEICV